MQTLPARPIPLIIPTSILHRQHPRNRISILERLALLPHSIAQLNTLRDRHVLALIRAGVVVTDLYQAVQARTARYVERLSEELGAGGEPGTYIAFDLDPDRVLGGFDVRYAWGHAAGDLRDVALLGLRGRATVAVHGQGGWAVAVCSHAHAHPHHGRHHTAHHASCNGGHVAECETAAAGPEWCRRSEGGNDACCEGAGRWWWEGHSASCVETETYTAMSTGDEVTWYIVSV